jgi:hypothetical protein
VGAVNSYVDITWVVYRRAAVIYGRGLLIESGLVEQLKEEVVDPGFMYRWQFVVANGVGVDQGFEVGVHAGLLLYV